MDERDYKALNDSLKVKTLEKQYQSQISELIDRVNDWMGKAEQLKVELAKLKANKEWEKKIDVNPEFTGFEYSAHLENFEGIKASQSVDVDALKEEYVKKFMERDSFYPVVVWNFFLPHLRTSGSDAVEFAEWIEPRYFKINAKEWNNKKHDSDEINYTTEMLYQEFLKSKTNETNNIKL